MAQTSNPLPSLADSIAALISDPVISMKVSWVIFVVVLVFWIGRIYQQWGSREHQGCIHADKASKGDYIPQGQIKPSGQRETKDVGVGVYGNEQVTEKCINSQIPEINLINTNPNIQPNSLNLSSATKQVQQKVKQLSISCLKQQKNHNDPYHINAKSLRKKSQQLSNSVMIQNYKQEKKQKQIQMQMQTEMQMQVFDSQIMEVDQVNLPVLSHSLSVPAKKYANLNPNGIAIGNGNGQQRFHNQNGMDSHECEWLKQKLKLDGQKLQQKSKLQVHFQKNPISTNSSPVQFSLIRKIEKHEIITDYLIPEPNQSHLISPKGNVIGLEPGLGLGLGLGIPVPIKKQNQLPFFPTTNSIIEIQYYKNYSSENMLPVIERRIREIDGGNGNTNTNGDGNCQLRNLKNNLEGQLSLRKIGFNSFFQHGKFRRMYKNIVKIGEGAFGTVYQAYNMLQAKKYAIKKIFISKDYKQIQNLLGEIKILNNLSHPNVVKYNSCWLQYAELNQQESYKKLIEGLVQRQKQKIKNKPYSNSTNKNKGLISLKILQQSQNIEQQSKNSNDNEQQYQQSYVSKQSGFSFAKSSESRQAKSSNFRKKQSIFLVQKSPLSPNPSETPSPSNSAGSQSQSGPPFGSLSPTNFLPVMYIQMELCEHSLAHYLKKRTVIDRIFAYEIICQLINAISYVHFMRIVHRDLKPENVLFSTNNGQIVAKIGDFGLALQAGRIQDEEQFEIKNTRAGTPSYIAPELYSPLVKKLNEEDLQKADIYSLAVIYYELLNKFSTSHERVQKLSLLKQGKVVGISQFKQQKKLIQQLLKNNRPKARDILLGQNWKKLTHIVAQTKKRMCKNYWMSKKQSLSTNASSTSNNATNLSNLGVNQLNIQVTKTPKKQKSKSKSKCKQGKAHEPEQQYNKQCQQNAQYQNQNPSQSLVEHQLQDQLQYYPLALTKNIRQNSLEIGHNFMGPNDQKVKNQLTKKDTYLSEENIKLYEREEEKLTQQLETQLYFKNLRLIKRSNSVKLGEKGRQRPMDTEEGGKYREKENGEDEIQIEIEEEEGSRQEKEEKDEKYKINLNKIVDCPQLQKQQDLLQNEQIQQPCPQPPKAQQKKSKQKPTKKQLRKKS